MNTNEIKGKIWNMCIEKGIFNKVKGDEFKNIQETFEKIIKGYEQVEPSQEIFNKIIDSLSFEIYNQTQNKNINQGMQTIEPQKIIPFETIQKEYNELLNTPIPNKIDFTNLKINQIEKTSDIIRDRTVYETESAFQNQSQNQTQSETQSENQNKIRLEEIIMTQNKILIQILETQVKILGILKK